MFKKIFISCLIFVACTPLAMAVNYKNRPHYQSRNHSKGEYKGIYKGEVLPAPPPKPAPLADFTPCITYNITPGPYLGINPGLRTNYNNTGSVYKAFEGTVFLGYAMLNSSFYLAGEIFGQHGTELQNYRNNVNVNLNPVGLRTTWGTGLSLIPGFLVTDSLMGFLRLGGIVTHFQDVGRSAVGGQTGIGLEGSVSESWDLRAEYIYSFYQSMDSVGSPRTDQFSLGIVYRFWT